MPRFHHAKSEATGQSVLIDGEVREWQGPRVHWDRRPTRLAHADRGAEAALASTGSGVALAMTIPDDHLVPAATAAALEHADHVEIELWPGDRDATGIWPGGILVRLGSSRELVSLVRPQDSWRQEAISSFAKLLPSGGYQLEARFPLRALAPLAAPRIESVAYRLTVYDSDEQNAPAEASQRFEGVAKLDPPLEVHEAVQKRASVRLCMASQAGALWAYDQGWHCAVPYRPALPKVDPDDMSGAPPDVELAHTRIPEPPLIVWIRERIVFLNFIGRERGLIALLDENDTLLSYLELGVVGAEDPGNPLVRDAGAEVLLLPDGTFAVVATHSYPAQAESMGGRCAGAQRILVSVIALRGALKSTPQAPAPPPPFPPFLEEVFRTTIEDCADRVANDWSLSDDARVIKVHSSLYPARPAETWTFIQGRYRRQEPARNEEQ